MKLSYLLRWGLILFGGSRFYFNGNRELLGPKQFLGCDKSCPLLLRGREKIQQIKDLFQWIALEKWSYT